MDPALDARTSGTAVVSLIFGILSWFALPVIGAIVAVICGHMARAEIRRSAGAVDGDGLALAGLILGWAHIALMIVALIFVVLFFGGLLAFLIAIGVANG